MPCKNFERNPKEHCIDTNIYPYRLDAIEKLDKRILQGRLGNHDYDTWPQYYLAKRHTDQTPCSPRYHSENHVDLIAELRRHELKGIPDQSIT
jgi:hypothetical protein